LLINKLDSENINEIIKEFINKFKEINYSDYCLFQKCIFFRMLKDRKFQNIYLTFYLKIKQIFDTILKINSKFLINLIEIKFKIDYQNINLDDEFIIKNLMCEDIDDLALINEFKLISDFDKNNDEESRINNLNLVLRLVQSNYLNYKILNEISEILVETSYIPDIYHLFSNKHVFSNINLSKYKDSLLLKSEKLKNNNFSNRYLVLLDRIIELTTNEQILCLECNDESSFDSIYEPNEDNLETLKENDGRDEFELEIENILDEYLLLEDVGEVNAFIKNCYEESKQSLPEIKIKEFVTQLINFYFKNNLSNFDKFKLLFLSFRNINFIKPEHIKNSLLEIIQSDYSIDYVNIRLKLDKLIEVLKIIKIKFNDEERNKLELFELKI
jgi:hypothetical protein